MKSWSVIFWPRPGQVGLWSYMINRDTGIHPTHSQGRSLLAQLPISSTHNIHHSIPTRRGLWRPTST